MGLAAAQARLLLLTARKSDLEYRAQQITNAEMMLAMQTEEIARDYSRKVSNQTVTMLEGGKEVAFTGKDLLAKYDVVYNENKYSPKREYHYHLKEGKEIPEEVKTWLLTNSDAFDDPTSVNWNSLTEDQWKAVKAYDGYPEDEDEQWYEEIATQDATPLDSMTAAEILELYRQGAITIYKKNSSEDVALDSSDLFVVRYDTSDDREAEAEYQQKTAALQVKEKRLQMELIEIETQQKACETEMESVKKIIQKNIEQSFKYFS